MRGLEVIYEDNHLIAINKKTGDLVHGDITGDEALDEMVKEYIKYRYNKPGDVWLGVLHRLDRPVSGVTIFARTSKAAERMSKMFKEKQIHKIYYAICDKRPPQLSGKLIHYLTKDEATNKVKVKNTEGGGSKKAELDYEVFGELGNGILLKINLITGRPHQARAQLAKINCPINGDTKYGSMVTYPNKSISLHCREMSFLHPVTKENIVIKADVPTTLQQWRMFADIVE
jgi:23S rRNA pseudouridine1911/1915/1917 synthase